MYNTVAVAAPVDPSSVPATKSANTSKSDVPTSVASVSKVPLVVPNALTLVAGINASPSPLVPIATVAVPESLFTVVTF